MAIYKYMCTFITKFELRVCVVPTRDFLPFAHNFKKQYGICTYHSSEIEPKNKENTIKTNFWGSVA